MKFLKLFDSIVLFHIFILLFGCILTSYTIIPGLNKTSLLK